MFTLRLARLFHASDTVAATAAGVLWVGTWLGFKSMLLVRPGPAAGLGEYCWGCVRSWLGFKVFVGQVGCLGVLSRWDCWPKVLRRCR